VEPKALPLALFSLTQKDEREKKAISYFAGRIFKGLDCSSDSTALWI
jgi:hypothetical protein